VAATSSILILGAGPTGLGAAWRLQQRGHSDWHLFDAAATAGGLAGSTVDAQGFTWDNGGHVLFSHYAYFDRLMDELLGQDWVEHVRESWVWIRERFIPYPFQNNIGRLPEEEFGRCLTGLIAAAQQRGAAPPADFGQWIHRTFGDGLADVFFLPYNRKVWAYEPSRLDTCWMGERVATVDVHRVVENAMQNRDDTSWGPNATFRFPLRGGTGAIWQALCRRLSPERVALGRKVVRVSGREKWIELDDGQRVAFDRLISTIPLNVLIESLIDAPDLKPLGERLVYSHTHVVGIGVEGPLPETLRTKCWMYFPEPETPFYRATVFSNYSPNNVPVPGRQWSLMCEVSESADKPVDAARVLAEVEEGLKRVRLLPENATVVSRWHRRLEHGYPTPFLGRDQVLPRIDQSLKGMGIWSRGRFGGWKYEVSNQDHALMQGVEAVDHLLDGSEEATYYRPDFVNSRPKAES
jgi:protoporphyrinogen oxidase